MATPDELIRAIMNDEKVLSRKAPVEALGPEMSQAAIAELKKAGVETVGQFQDMELDKICALECDYDVVGEILEHWSEI